MNPINIKQYLETLPNQEPVYYYPNHGNAGDSLIAYATFQLFEELNINYRLLNQSKFDPTGKILIYGGGGGLLGYYSDARKIIQKYHPFVKKLIIFPHTITDNEDLLKELGYNVDIITREDVSYNHVKKYNHKSNIILMDDLAFSLNVEDILSRNNFISFFESTILKVIYKLRKDERISTIPSPRRMLNSSYVEMVQYMKRLLGNDENKILNCFRTDIEKTDVNLPINNLDLSAIFAYGTRNVKQTFCASYQLLNFMNKYREIRTNRLHLGIAGALLGKEVKFYPNSYYKCEAVYQFSMKKRFPNVQWMG